MMVLYFAMMIVFHQQAVTYQKVVMMIIYQNLKMILMVSNISESNYDEIPIDSSEDEDSSIQESSEEERLDTDQQTDILAISSKHTTSNFDHALSIGLLSIMDKHSLSYACVTDMLKLFKVSVPGFSLSLHMLLKKYVQPKDSLKFHHCCSVCMKFLDSTTSCDLPECKAKGLPTSSFIELRLDYQLKLLFTGT